MGKKEDVKILYDLIESRSLGKLEVIDALVDDISGNDLHKVMERNGWFNDFEDEDEEDTDSD
jgi:hypothetical protein